MDRIENLIAKVHDYFTEEYELLKLMKPAERLSHVSKISWRTARATGVSQAAVREVLSKQATRTRTKRQRPPQRPDERHQPPKKPRTARYKPKQADSSSEEGSCGGDEDDGEHSTTEHVDEPEVYVQLAGVKTEPDACADDRELADPISVNVKTKPQNERDATCRETAALSAAKRHKGSIKQRHAGAPAASCVAPSGQLPLPPDQQLTLHNPLTNQQGFS